MRRSPKPAKVGGTQMSPRIASHFHRRWLRYLAITTKEIRTMSAIWNGPTSAEAYSIVRGINFKRVAVSLTYATNPAAESPDRPSGFNSCSSLPIFTAYKQTQARRLIDPALTQHPNVQLQVVTSK